MNNNIKTLDRNLWVLAACLIATITALFYASMDSLVEMERLWSTKEEYGYAYMIPFITGYFIWQRLDKLADINFDLSWVGGLIFLCALSIMLLGILSATHSIAQYGFIIATIAAAYMYLGLPALRIIIAPMLLLLLIVPLPAFIFNNLSAYLQLVSSEIGVWVIRLFGISVYLEGNVIDLGAYKLQVVEACSGLRYLFPLFSLSLIAAFLYNASFWKRTVIVLSSLPITVFMNSFRIGVIGVLVDNWGVEQAEGFLHDFEGWIVFMACSALLVFEMWLLLKIGSDSRKLSEVFALELPDNSALKFRAVHLDARHITVTVIAIALAVIIGLVNEREEIIPDRESLAGFPLAVDDWRGQRGTIEKVVLDELRLDDYLMADYVSENGDVVNYYVAYYKTQRSGQAAHSPKSCIPGGGWKIKNFSTRPGVILSADSESNINRLLISKGEQAQLVYYWFPQRGRVITNEYMVKWYLFWDALTLNRTDGALVRLTTSVSPGEDISKADERLVNFASQVQPLMQKYLPN